MKKNTYLPTPYYLIDERKLLKNLKKIAFVKKHSGAKSVLATKCFSTWCVFKLMSQYMDGTTSSSPYEVRLGYEEFGKETHAYSVGYSDEDIREVKRCADKIIFNSVSQLKRYYNEVRNLQLGLRVNPGISYSHFDLADPARQHSRLGVIDKKAIEKVAPILSGLMFHFNCENDDFKHLSSTLDLLGKTYGDLLKAMKWVSLGGGIYFTKEGYPLDRLCRKLKDFSRTYGVQVYLEPGESAITNSTELVTSVLDIVHNEQDIAIVDASTEAHMLDLLIYRQNAKIMAKENARHPYTVAGRSCLAGDIFGTYNFSKTLKPGDTVRFVDAAGYTMVKKNWFNGLKMPSIAVKRLNGKTELIRRFTYKDFKENLS
jgi:carboxynorspermidine decarboxylase